VERRGGKRKGEAYRGKRRRLGGRILTLLAFWRCVCLEWVRGVGCEVGVAKKVGVGAVLCWTGCREDVLLG
jgi:hypothetical protein